MENSKDCISLSQNIVLSSNASAKIVQQANVLVWLMIMYTYMSTEGSCHDLDGEK